MSLKNLSAVPGNNTLAPPNGAPESSTKLKDFNDILRQLMADTRTLAASNTIASAATTDLGSLDETWLTVSGVTTITSFGTVSAGIYKLVTFSGALTLTHNATSLILLTGANRTTVAGDCGLYLSLGGGNWKEYFYSPIGGYQPLDATLTALAGTLTAPNKIIYATAADTAGELNRSTDGTLAGNSDINIPTEKAVKTYVDNQSTKTLLVRHELAAGTNGGTFTSGAWQTRPLNTTVVNTISGASLAVNQITLPAGTYLVRTAATGALVDAHKSRLQNITDTVSYIGLVADARAASPGSETQATGTYQFTITAAKVFELQHYCQTTRASDGFGQGLGAATGGVTEVFAEVYVQKIG